MNNQMSGNASARQCLVLHHNQLHGQGEEQFYVRYSYLLPKAKTKQKEIFQTIKDLIDLTDLRASCTRISEYCRFEMFPHDYKQESGQINSAELRYVPGQVALKFMDQADTIVEVQSRVSKKNPHLKLSDKNLENGSSKHNIVQIMRLQQLKDGNWDLPIIDDELKNGIYSIRPAAYF